MMSSNRIETKYGALCTDSSGLSLGAKGNIDSSKSGVYSTILRLASQLDGCHSSTNMKPPLVSIESNSSNILIKEYNSHTVVLRIPTTTTTTTSNNNRNDTSTETMSFQQGNTTINEIDNMKHSSSGNAGFME